MMNISISKNIIVATESENIFKTIDWDLRSVDGCLSNISAIVLSGGIDVDVMMVVHLSPQKGTAYRQGCLETYYGT